MNRVRPHGLAALTALSVLMVILLVAGCGAIGSGGSSVRGAGRSSDAATTVQRVEAAGDGIAGCTALLGGHQPAASDYPRIRAQFARSQWPDLRIAGTSYVDLAVKLRTARSDGYETVWFYQRLSAACTRHGWKEPPASGK
jgi:hypothetical protein